VVSLLTCLAGDRVEDELAQMCVGLEAAQPSTSWFSSGSALVIVWVQPSPWRRVAQR
jgi:hypothetical protein